MAEIEEDLTKRLEQAERQVRVRGIVMLIMGVALIFSSCTLYRAQMTIIESNRILDGTLERLNRINEQEEREQQHHKVEMEKDRLEWGWVNGKPKE